MFVCCLLCGFELANSKTWQANNRQTHIFTPAKKGFRAMKKILNSPYLLATIPIILGGMWLVLHPGIITNNLDKPYALLAGPAFVGSILLGWLFVAFFKTIAAWCKQSWQAFPYSTENGSTIKLAT